MGVFPFLKGLWSMKYCSISLKALAVEDNLVWFGQSNLSLLPSMKFIQSNYNRIDRIPVSTTLCAAVIESRGRVIQPPDSFYSFRCDL